MFIEWIGVVGGYGENDDRRLLPNKTLARHFISKQFPPSIHISTSQLQPSQSALLLCQHFQSRTEHLAPTGRPTTHHRPRLPPPVPPNPNHVLHHHPAPLAPAQTLPIRSHLLPIHADAHRENHLQYAPLSSCPFRPLPLRPFTINTNSPNYNTTDSFLFLFLSMIIIAASLYLPEHITTIASRAWFYYAGDDAGLGVPEGVGLGKGGGVVEGGDAVEMLGRL